MSYVVRCAVRRCGGRRWRPTCSPRLGLFCPDGSNDWEDSFIHSSWSIHKPGSTYTFLTQTSDCHRVQSGSKAVAKSPTSWQRICGRNWRVRGGAKSAGRGCVGGWLRNGNNRVLLLYKRIWIWINIAANPVKQKMSYVAPLYVYMWREEVCCRWFPRGNWAAKIPR